MEFKLPNLPYSKDALAPYMSSETLEYHYGKHHQAYVDNLNRLLKDHTELQGKDLDDVVKTSYNKETLVGVYNNAAQHYNHIMFWEGMSKHETENIPPKVLECLNNNFGSVKQFKDQFIAEGMSVFGSGWVWFCLAPNGQFMITKYSNAVNPLSQDHIPILGCDVWEHSYYIDYRNQRAQYLQTYVDHLIHWEYLESRIVKL